MQSATTEIAWREKEQAEVRAVLATLTRSPLMARLFSYVCDKYFEGDGEQISEIKIAREVFGRSAAFDRSQDSIARVEAHRLRKKLKQYYESEGKYHAVQVELLPGTYVPFFRRKEETEIVAPPGQDVTAVEHDRFTAETPLSDEVQLAPFKLPPPSTTESTPPAPPRLPRSYLWWYLGAGVAVALLIFGVARAPLARLKTAAAISSDDHPSVVPTGTLGAGAPVEVRILCGYDGLPHLGRLGELWTKDRYYSGGRPWPARHGFVRRTNDPFLFQMQRTGEFSYDIPVQPGLYELHLYFLETEYGEDLGGGENSRTFLIRLNGATLFQTFDPLSDAGGPRIADERVFKDVRPASDGKLHLSFESQRGQPILTAIELLPGIPHKQLPIRLVTQVNSYTDHYGQIWAPDNYYLGGQIFGGKPPVGNTQDPLQFATERAGNFNYAIPVDTHGSYTANLYFAETYFGPDASGVGGVGSRVFNVMCNGVMLLDRFDILKEAGDLRAVKKSFHGLKPNAQGKLILTFEPVANYASVFAIEVLDESK